MEESPHKCPVCSRSFNQRSNLKTHLLTHTDHKPYECTSCGKVFRRNCDLRRHTLTHAVGGDVPNESLDIGGESEHNLSGDEDDSVLEVDSPEHSPVRRPQSPSPAMSGSGGGSDSFPTHDKSEDVVDTHDGDGNATPQAVIKDSIGITHCHHDGGSTSSYTMRPNHERERSSFSKSYLQQSDTYLPMLHVRRDLHHKSSSLALLSSTITSDALEPGPSFLGAMRKRHFGSDGNTHPILNRYPPNIGNNYIARHNLLKQSEEIMMPPIISQSIEQPLPENSSTSHQNALKSPSASSTSSGLSSSSSVTHQPTASPSSSTSYMQSSGGGIPPPTVPLNIPAAPPPQPRRTGFTIEDIMRR